MTNNISGDLSESSNILVGNRYDAKRDIIFYTHQHGSRHKGDARVLVNSRDTPRVAGSSDRHQAKKVKILLPGFRNTISMRDGKIIWPNIRRERGLGFCKATNTSVGALVMQRLSGATGYVSLLYCEQWVRPDNIIAGTGKSTMLYVRSQAA